MQQVASWDPVLHWNKVKGKTQVEHLCQYSNRDRKPGPKHLLSLLVRRGHQITKANKAMQAENQQQGGGYPVFCTGGAIPVRACMASARSMNQLAASQKCHKGLLHHQKKRKATQAPLGQHKGKLVPAETSWCRGLGVVGREERRCFRVGEGWHSTGEPRWG